MAAHITPHVFILIEALKMLFCIHLPFAVRLSTCPNGCGIDGSRIHDPVRPHSSATWCLADRTLHSLEHKLTSPSSTHRRARAQQQLTTAQSEPDHDRSEVMFTPAVQQSDVTDQLDNNESKNAHCHCHLEPTRRSELLLKVNSSLKMPTQELEFSHGSPSSVLPPPPPRPCRTAAHDYLALSRTHYGTAGKGNPLHSTPFTGSRIFPHCKCLHCPSALLSGLVERGRGD